MNRRLQTASSCPQKLFIHGLFNHFRKNLIFFFFPVTEIYFLNYYIKIHRMLEYKFQRYILSGRLYIEIWIWKYIYISPAILIGEIKLNIVF